MRGRQAKGCAGRRSLADDPDLAQGISRLARVNTLRKIGVLRQRENSQLRKKAEYRLYRQERLLLRSESINGDPREYDGCGFIKARQGRGLPSMCRHPQDLGARLDITPSPEPVHSARALNTRSAALLSA